MLELEARVLAESSHPDVVRHIAHGTIGTGDPFLAMGWFASEPVEPGSAKKPRGAE